MPAVVDGDCCGFEERKGSGEERANQNQAALLAGFDCCVYPCSLAENGPSFGHHVAAVISRPFQIMSMFTDHNYAHRLANY